MTTTTWYIDFEGYQYNNRYIVKEITILNRDDTLQCFNYFTKNPSDLNKRPINQTIDYQYKRHKLNWNFGDWHFLDAIADILLKVKCGDTVYVKGTEKMKFLKRWLPQIEEITWITTPFKKLRNCFSEVCEIGHGLNCSRRKVFELYYADVLCHKACNMRY